MPLEHARLPSTHCRPARSPCSCARLPRRTLFRRRPRTRCARRYAPGRCARSPCCAARALRPRSRSRWGCSGRESRCRGAGCDGRRLRGRWAVPQRHAGLRCRNARNQCRQCMSPIDLHSLPHHHKDCELPCSYSAHEVWQLFPTKQLIGNCLGARRGMASRKIELCSRRPRPVVRGFLAVLARGALPMSAAGNGLLNRKPCSWSQPAPSTASACCRVSTPSATVDMCSFLARPAIASMIAAQSVRWRQGRARSCGRS